MSASLSHKASFLKQLRPKSNDRNVPKADRMHRRSSSGESRIKRERTSI
jgi:hypothetical protein